MASTAWRHLLPEKVPMFFLHAKEQNLLLGGGMVMPQLCQAL